MGFLGALLLATTVASDLENPRIASPNGDYVVVIRHHPRIADFDRVNKDEYWRREELEAEAESAPKEPRPTRGAIYRLWPGDYRELRGEFAFEPGEQYGRVLVSNDGYVVTHGLVACGVSANLLTIRAPDGEIVRKMPVREAMTVNDQQWLCRGAETDVRFAIDRTLRVTMLVTDSKWEDFDARHHTVDIDLETGRVDGPPERDHCPAALLVLAEAHDAGGHLLLDRAITRVQPEYPEVAAKARIGGIVRVKVVVGAEGRVESATIVKPLPFGCDQAVSNAIAQWEFAAGETSVTGVIAFRFEIVRHVRLVTMAVQ